MNEPIVIDNKYVGIVVGVLIVVLLLGLFGYAVVWPISRSLGAMGWQQTDCTITNVSMQSPTPGSSNKRGASNYKVKVAYRYEVDGKSYDGNRYDFGVGGAGDRRYVRRIVDDLKRHNKTVCYVNPEEPTESVLTQQLPWSAILIGIGFLTVLGGGIVAWFSGVRPDRLLQAATKSQRLT